MWKIEKGCMGCGICTFQCPNGLKMENGMAKITDDSSICLVQAAQVCPKQIINQ